MSSQQEMTTLRRVQGFTLVEALVALLVLSFGLLGVAGMQLKALQSAHAGYQRSIASLAAQDAVELLWSELDLTTCPGASALIGEGGGDSWKARWEGFLPELEDPITDWPEADEACVYKIRIAWEEGRLEGDGDPVFEYTTRLPEGGG